MVLEKHLLLAILIVSKYIAYEARNMFKQAHLEYINECVDNFQFLGWKYKNFFKLYNKIMEEASTATEGEKKHFSQQLSEIMKDDDFDEVAKSIKKALLEKREVITEEVNQLEARWQSLDTQWREADKQIQQPPILDAKKALEGEKINLEKQIQEIATPRMAIERYVEDVHPLIAGFSFEKRHIKNFEAVVERAKHALNLLDAHIDLETSQKLTLAELGKFRKIAKYREYFDKLEKIGIPIHNEFQNLRNLCAASKQVESALIEKFSFNASMNEEQIYRSGDFVSTQRDKNDAYKLRTTDGLSLSDRGKRFLSDYDHSSQLVAVNDSSRLMQSHLWGKHTIEDINYQVVMESDVHRVNVSKLIDPKFHARLQTKYKDKWEETIQKMYEEKINAIAQNPRLAQDSFKILVGNERYYTALPNIETPTMFVTREKKQTLGLFNEEGNVIKDKIVCSEFVARQFGEALKQVQEDVATGIEIVNPLQGYNLAHITPGKLIKILDKKGCIEKIENPYINQLVNTQSHYKKLLKDHVVLTASLCKKLEKLLEENESNKEEFIQSAKRVVSGYVDAYYDPLSAQQEEAERIKQSIESNLTNIFVQREGMGALKKFFYDLLTAIGLYKSEVEWIVRQTFAPSDEKEYANRFNDHKSKWRSTDQDIAHEERPDSLSTKTR